MKRSLSLLFSRARAGALMTLLACASTACAPPEARDPEPSAAALPLEAHTDSSEVQRAGPGADDLVGASTQPSITIDDLVALSVLLTPGFSGGSASASQGQLSASVHIAQSALAKVPDPVLTLQAKCQGLSTSTAWTSPSITLPLTSSGSLAGTTPTSGPGPSEAQLGPQGGEGGVLTLPVRVVWPDGSDDSIDASSSAYLTPRSYQCSLEARVASAAHLRIPRAQASSSPIDWNVQVAATGTVTPSDPAYANSDHVTRTFPVTLPDGSSALVAVATYRGTVQTLKGVADPTAINLSAVAPSTVDVGADLSIPINPVIQLGPEGSTFTTPVVVGLPVRASGGGTLEPSFFSVDEGRWIRCDESASTGCWATDCPSDFSSGLTCLATTHFSAWTMGQIQVKLNFDLNSESMKNATPWNCQPGLLCPKNLQYNDGNGWWKVNSLVASTAAPTGYAQLSYDDEGSWEILRSDLIEAGAGCDPQSNGAGACPFTPAAPTSDTALEGWNVPISGMTRPGWGSARVSLSLDAVYCQVYMRVNQTSSCVSVPLSASGTSTQCPNNPQTQGAPTPEVPSKSIFACLNLEVQPNLASATVSTGSTPLLTMTAVSGTKLIPSTTDSFDQTFAWADASSSQSKNPGWNPPTSSQVGVTVASDRSSATHTFTEGAPKTGGRNQVRMFVHTSSYGDVLGPEVTVTGVNDDGDGYSKGDGDCDDSNKYRYPGNAEICDGYDNDCNSGTVPSTGTETDVDNDQYVGCSSFTTHADLPAKNGAGKVLLGGGDCNDGSTAIKPGATETCNGIDDNCVNGIDEGVTSSYYVDGDADTYGKAGSTATQACSKPAGYSANSTDCNDETAAIKPGATETCNGLDDNCNLSIDEGLATATYYADVDGDGYGDADMTVKACSRPPAPNDATNSTDCNDGNPATYPGALELCDFQDNNCDGEIDDGVYYQQVAGGNDHTLALCSDGTAWAWGLNSNGQLGDGTNTQRPLPVKVKLPTGTVITAVAAGQNHSLVVDTKGAVWAWGLNNFGQLGDGTNTSRTTPVQVKLPAGTVANAIAAGVEHSLVVDNKGVVWAWGSNYYGQLGDGTTTNRATPVQVKLPAGTVGTAIAAGASHSLVVDNKGAAWAWGRNSSGLLGDGTATDRPLPVQVLLPVGTVASAVAGGQDYSLALDSKGVVWAWGANRSGQLGDGTIESRSTPVQVQLPAGTVATLVAAGDYHSLALDTKGTVWAWGGNSFGELGDGTTENRSSPIQAMLPSGAVVTAVAAGADYSLAVDNEGSAWAWGRNDNGQLGDGTTTDRPTPVPVKLPAGTVVTEIAAGFMHSLAVDSKGAVWGWGWNPQGQLGDGTATDRPLPVHVLLPVSTVAKAAAAGFKHSLALDNKGAVWAWGDNYYGQLGDGTKTDRDTPVLMKLPAGAVATAVAGGERHSLALDNRGAIWACGKNDYGQLGDGTTTSRTTAVQVKLPAGTVATAVAAGHNHSLTVDAQGAVWAWGSNSSGQLGDGTKTNQNTPVQVKLPAGTMVTAVAAGGYHSLALDSKGVVWAWGDNGYCQLGDGTLTDRTTPVQVNHPAGTVATSVAAGRIHSLAADQNGIVWTWGWNGYGQLGDDTHTSRYSPVQVKLPSGFAAKAVAAGYGHSLAVDQNGSLNAWGDDTYGQIGDGLSAVNATPIQTEGLP